MWSTEPPHDLDPGFLQPHSLAHCTEIHWPASLLFFQNRHVSTPSLLTCSFFLLKCSPTSLICTSSFFTLFRSLLKLRSFLTTVSKIANFLPYLSTLLYSFFFLTFKKLRLNLYTVKFTLLKFTIQWFLIYSELRIHHS